MTGYETYEKIETNLNTVFASMSLDVRAVVMTNMVRLMSADRDQLELAAAFAFKGATKANPSATIGDAYEGRRGGWVREIAYA